MDDARATEEMIVVGEIATPGLGLTHAHRQGLARPVTRRLTTGLILGKIADETTAVMAVPLLAVRLPEGEDPVRGQDLVLIKSIRCTVTVVLNIPFLVLFICATNEKTCWTVTLRIVFVLPHVHFTISKVTC